MERIINYFKNERGAVPLWLTLPLAGFALWQVIRQIKSIEKEIKDEGESGLIDQREPEVIDGEIIDLPSRESMEVQGR